MAIKRATYEQSPVSLFLDFEMPRLMAANAAAERERQHEMAMEDKRTERQLNVAAWQSNEEKLTNLENAFIKAGLKVKPEFQTEGYADLSKDILNKTRNKSQALLNTIQEGDTQISWMQDQLAELEAGRQYGKQMETAYGAYAEPVEDRGFESYMLQGGFKKIDDGDWVPTEGSEIEAIFKDLQKNKDDKQITRFANDAFRTGFLSGRRTEDEARSLMKLDQDIQLSKIQLAGANEDIEQKRYESAIGKLDDAATQIQLGFRNYGNTYAGKLKLGETSYGLIQLYKLDAQTDIFVEFREMMNNGKISKSVYDDVVGSIMALRSAVHGGKDPYPERHFVKMAAKANDDIVAHDFLEEKALADPSFRNSDEYRKSSKVVRSWLEVGIGRDRHQLEKAKELQQTFDLVEASKFNTIIGEAELSAGGVNLDELGIDIDPDILNARAKGENKFAVATGIYDEGDPDLTLGEFASDKVFRTARNITGADYGGSVIDMYDYLLNTPMQNIKGREVSKDLAEILRNFPTIGPYWGKALEWLDPSLFEQE